MPFRVILATSPTEDFVDARLSLTFKTSSGWVGEADFAFGELSGIERVVYEASYPDDPALSVDLAGAVHTQGKNVGFSLKNLFSNDTLHMIAFSPKYFLGNVLHEAYGVASESRQPRCVATCADGTSGQGCVTCVKGEITVKICC